MLLQLMLPASPAASVASVASDCSDAYPPPPPPPPPAPAHAARFEDMKVSDLRAECKRRNLRVSGPKPQLIDRLRPFLIEKQEEPPRSPSSVASVASFASIASPDSRIEEPEDIVQSQRRQIEELERKLEASRQQLENVRRDAAGAAASDQSRRLLQARICVSQLRAQLDALQQQPAPAPLQPVPVPVPTPRYVLAASDAAPDRLVRLFTVTPPTSADQPADVAPAKNNPAYILNGVKVVPIAILPTHYEPERAAPPPPPPPPLPPPPQAPLASLHDNTEGSQIMDDVLEILVENGELPPSAVGESSNPSIESYLPEADTFSPADVLGDTQIRESSSGDDLQRELDNIIQNEIMTHADLHSVGNGVRDVDPTATDIDTDLSVDLLSNDEFRDFGGSDHTSDQDDFLQSLLSGHRDERMHVAMDIGEDPPERMSMTPLTNGDLLDHNRPGFEDMDDLSLPSFQNEDTRHSTFTFDERPCEFDFKDFGGELGSNMNVDSDGYDFMDTEIFPNHFGRGHIPQCDPLLGGVLSRPPPRPARKHYSWDKIEFDAT